MKNLSKILMLVMLLPLLAAAVSCGGDDGADVEATLQLSFESLQGACSGGIESFADINMEQGVLSFSGVAITPDPCHVLESDMQTVTSDEGVLQITIDITATGSEDICVLCIGAVHFEGEVDGLGSGPYHVKIVYDGSVIGEIEG